MSTQTYEALLRDEHITQDFLAMVKANLAEAKRLWPFAMRPMPADRAAGCLLCVGIGDAVGRPAESRNPPTSLTRYEPWRGRQSGPSGTITDDTQMTMWLAQSLLACGGFDGDDLVRRFTSERIRGIGAATRQFVSRAKSGLPWYEAGVKSAGNGVAMRSAPVGIRHAANLDELVACAGLQALITHNDPMAIASGIVVAAAVALLGCATVADAQALTVEKTAARFSRALGELIRGMEDGHNYRTRNTDEPDTLCRRLTETVPELVAADAGPAEADKVLWSGAYVLESLPFALFCFLRRPTDPIGAILDAVNYSRDSDTVGAIAGSFAGALNGVSGIDPYWINELEYAGELEGLGRGLAKAGERDRGP